jgi:hypothetical protein
MSKSVKGCSYGLYFMIMATKYPEQTNNCKAARYYPNGNNKIGT